MAFRIGMAWLIIGCIIFMPGTFIITYIISVLLEHVPAVFPYISDTGAHPPESCIFGQMLNIASVFVAVTMYVRYCQVNEHLSMSQCRLQRANKAALGLGFIAAFGVSIVANFQETNVLPVHILGAIMAFGIGMVYIWMHGVMSYWMQQTTPPLNGRAIFIVRMICCIICTVTFIFTVVFGNLSFNYNTIHPAGSQKSYHNLSTGAEWLMSFVMLAFFITYIGEFQRLSVEAPLVLKTGRPSVNVSETLAQNGNMIVCMALPDIYCKHDLYHDGSAAAEWIMGAVLLIFFVTFINEFRNIRAELPTFRTARNEPPTALSSTVDEPLLTLSSI